MRTDVLALLRDAGQNLEQAADLICQLLASWPEDRGLRQRITQCEEEGDRITHRLVNGLHRSKLAHYDRSDIYALAGAIDDVVDDIEEASEALALYQIEAPMEQAEQLAGVLRDAGRALSRALNDLEGSRDIDQHLRDIRRLEQEGDRIYREALGALFDGAIDPMFVIRWKDIYAALEEAIDRCRTAGNRLQSIIVKHA